MFKFYNKSHEYYDKIANVYDDMYKDRYWMVARTQIEEVIKKYVGTIQDKLILDVGSGTGEWSLWAAKRGAIVHLLEPSKEMLEISENKLSSHLNLDILNLFKFYNTTIEEFQSKDLDSGIVIRYDIIFLIGDILSYVKDLDKALSSIKSVCKSGTILLGTVDNYYSYVKDTIIYGEWSHYVELEKFGRITIGSEYGAFSSRGFKIEDFYKISEKYDLEILELTGLAVFEDLKLNMKYAKYFINESEHILFLLIVK